MLVGLGVEKEFLPNTQSPTTKFPYDLCEKSKLLVVVSSELAETSRWDFAQGTYMFEILESAKEYLNSQVELFVFRKEKSMITEFNRLERKLVEDRFTHLLASLESDPGSPSWNWDYFAHRAGRSWNGMVIGLSTDSVYRLHQLRFNRFVGKFRNTCVVGIDAVMDEKYLNANNHYGPTLLPISKKSIDIIDQKLKGYSLEGDPSAVAFVGAMYPYRLKLIEKLRKINLDVVVNPHTAGSSESTKNNASYVNYVRALRKGKLALNLSRANGINVNQLKSRVLESPVFGVPVLSDDRELASRFFDCDSEFVFFQANRRSIETISKVVNCDDELINISKAAQKKARAIAQSCFWETVRIACSRVNTNA